MKTHDRVLAALATSSLTKGGMESALKISNSAARRAVVRLLDLKEIEVCGSEAASPSTSWRGGRRWKVYAITTEGRAQLARMHRAAGGDFSRVEP